MCKSIRKKYENCLCMRDAIARYNSVLFNNWLDFYITDKKYNWIITKNHHDIVQFLGQGLDEQEIRNVLLPD